MSGELICKRFEGLKSARVNWEEHWQQIAEVIAPRYNDFLGDRTEGDKRMSKVYDSSGIMFNELLAAGLHGMATNPATRWFGLRVLDERLMEKDSIREYLSDTESAMFREMHSPQASVSTHLHENYLDTGAFGTGVLFIGDREGRPLFQARHLREMYLADGADGETDTVFRCFRMTVRQLKEMSERPENPWKMPEIAMRDANAEKWENKHEVIHAVFPRAMRDKTAATRENMPWASIYVCKQGKEILDEGGFEEFPYAVLPWSKNPGEPYGRGPGMTALPDVKMLQEMMKIHIRAGQKLVDPPLKVSDELAFQPIKLMPGGLNFLRPGTDIAPLLTGGRLDISLEMMQDVRNRVGQIFFADVVRPFTERTNETATEVMQRVQQQMRLMGPILGRLERFLGQIITRVYGIMQRNGKLPDPPEELADQPFTVEFVSPIATAQRSGEVENLNNWLAMNSQLLEISPEVKRRIAFGKIPEWSADRMRIDPELVNDDDEVAELEQNDQMQQMAAMAQPAAQAADSAAGAIQKLRGVG